MKTILKRILEFGIFIFIIIIVLVFYTGGIKYNFFGLQLTARHLLNPITILILLSFVRIFISLEKKNALLLFVSTIICLIFLETAIRMWNPTLARPQQAYLHRASSTIGWELIPGTYGVGKLGNEIQINSAGFRDAEYNIDKSKDILRIMTVGDSFTFGMGVNLVDTYAKQLEQLLLKSGKPVEVINCGVIGYLMWQNVANLKQKVIKYNPDLVILSVFLNDIQQSVHPYKGNAEWKGINPYEKKEKRLANICYIYNLIKNFDELALTYRYRKGHAYLKGVEERKATFNNPTPENLMWHKIMHGKLEKKYYLEFVDALKDFIDTAANAGAKTIVCMIPDAAQLNQPERQHINRFVGKTCAELGVPFIDTTARFEEEDDPKPLFLFPEDAHTSPLGHRLIAEEIASLIH